MSHITRIRDLNMKGKTKAEICRETGYDFKTVKKYIEQEDFNEKIPTQEDIKSKLNPYKGEIKKIIDDNKKSWYKQRITAQRIYNILKTENEEFDLSYSTVRRFVKAYKLKNQIEEEKNYSRLLWHPGEAQADFGEADFIITDGSLKRYKYFVISFPYSNKAFTQIYSGENCECVCQALKNVFEHINGVPKLIVFDNATGIGRRTSNVLQENKEFILFRLHYKFLARFTSPYSGNEKGSVESNVGYIRRNLFTPEIKIPKDIETFNKNELFTMCNDLVMKNRNHYIKNIPVNDLFKDDVATLIEMPAKPFTVRKIFTLKVNGYNEIKLGTKHLYTLNNFYSHKIVTVVTTAWKVSIYDLEGIFIESFEREYGDERTETISIRTEISNILRKPNSWPNSKLRTDIGEEDPFVQYLDSVRDNKKVSSIFYNFKQIIGSYGFDTILRASQKLIEQQRDISQSNLLMLCSRLETNSPYFSENSTGVDLNQYNKLMGLDANNNVIVPKSILKEEII